MTRKTRPTEGVFQRGGVWWIRYSVGGQQYRESAKTRHKEQAVALLRKRQTEVFEGRFFPDRKLSDLTVQGLRTMWLEAAARKASIKHDEKRLARIVEHFKPNTLVSTITSEDIDKFTHVLARTPTRLGEGFAPATINRYLAVLHATLRLAERRGYRHRNPMAGVKLLPEDNERDRICTGEEYARLIDAADAELRTAIVLAYWTGMRLGEIAHLARDRIDIKRRTIRLARSATKEKKAKQVPLPRVVIEEMAKLPHSLDGKLFRSESDTLSGRFRDLCKRLSIDGLRFHDFRHTALTNMRRAGLDIMTMKQISGHRTLKMLERYNTVDEADLRVANERLEHYLGAKP